MWRLLDNWLTEVVVSHPAESSVVTQRILRNADWRKAEPAAEYIYHKVFGDDDEHWFAKECGVDLKEFREIVGGVRAWLNVEALRLKKVLTDSVRQKPEEGALA
jgi:hypothetical protein